MEATSTSAAAQPVASWNFEDAAGTQLTDNSVVVHNLGDSASPSTPPWFGIAFLKIADTQ